MLTKTSSVFFCFVFLNNADDEHAQDSTSHWGGMLLLKAMQSKPVDYSAYCKTQLPLSMLVVDSVCSQGLLATEKRQFSPLSSLQSHAQLASNVCTVIHVGRLNSPPPASPAPPVPPSASLALVPTHPATFIANKKL